MTRLKRGDRVRRAEDGALNGVAQLGTVLFVGRIAVRVQWDGDEIDLCHRSDHLQCVEACGVTPENPYRLQVGEDIPPGVDYVLADEPEYE